MMVYVFFFLRFCGSLFIDNGLLSMIVVNGVFFLRFARFVYAIYYLVLLRVACVCCV